MIRFFLLILPLLLLSCTGSSDAGKGSSDNERPPFEDKEEEAKPGAGIPFSLKIPDIFLDESGMPRAPLRLLVELDSSLYNKKDLSFKWELNSEELDQGGSFYLDCKEGGHYRLSLKFSDEDSQLKSFEKEFYLEPPLSFDLSGRLYFALEPRRTLGYSDDDASEPIAGEILLRLSENTEEALSLIQEDKSWIIEEWDGKRALLVRAASYQGEDLNREDLLKETYAKIRELSFSKGIVWASPNYRRRFFDMRPNDSLYAQDSDCFWPLEVVRAPLAWQYSQGEGALVAVLDSGILSSHPDLRDNIGEDGYDFIRMNRRPEDLGGSKHFYHGSEVAGIIAALKDNKLGIAGVAPRATLMPLRIIGAQGDIDSWTLAQALRYASGLQNSSGLLPSKKADVINLSLGGPGVNRMEKEAVNAALAQNVFIVAAAGNDGSSTKNYPAAYPGVFAVSGVDRDLNRARLQHGSYGYSYGSNYGDWIDIAAPWGPVCTTSGPLNSLDGAYAKVQGTSFSTAFVSGVLALMRSLLPDLSLVQAESILKTGGMTYFPHNPGKNQDTGWGIVDAPKALLSVANSLIRLEPELPDFGIFRGKLFLYLSPAEGKDLRLLDIKYPDYISLKAEELFSNGFGLYSIELLRDDPKLPEEGRAELELLTSLGPFSFFVEFDSLSGNTFLPDSKDFKLVLEDMDGGGYTYLPLDFREDTMPHAVFNTRLFPGFYRFFLDKGDGNLHPLNNSRVLFLHPETLDSSGLDFFIKDL